MFFFFFLLRNGLIGGLFLSLKSGKSMVLLAARTVETITHLLVFTLVKSSSPFPVSFLLVSLNRDRWVWTKWMPHSCLLNERIGAGCTTSGDLPGRGAWEFTL